jgi:maintenance of morphology protein 1
MKQDHITVSEVDFGEDFPVLSNARVRPSDEKGRVVRVVL